MRTGRPLLRCDKPGTLQKLLRRTSLPGPAPAWAANRRRRGKILGELSIPRPILTTIAQMADSEAAMNLLRKVPLFASLKDEDKVCIEEREEWRLPAGEMLVEEGKHAEYFFVLLEGEIATASFFSLRSRTMAVESRPRPDRRSLRCPSSQPRAAQARGSAWLSATGSSSKGITEKSTSARVRMAHNLVYGCRLNRPRTLSLSERPEYIVR